MFRRNDMSTASALVLSTRRPNASRRSVCDHDPNPLRDKSPGVFLKLINTGQATTTTTTTTVHDTGAQGDRGHHGGAVRSSTSAWEKPVPIRRSGSKRNHDWDTAL